MATLDRAQLAPVSLPTEELPMAALGGTVLVRGMDMPQMLQFAAARRRALVPQAGESEQEAAERAGGELAPLLLSMCVVLDDGLPVYSAAQWATLGGRHPQAVLDVWAVAVRLSGQDPVAEKKT